jgi:GDP-D-mannose dehydratase
VAKLYSYWIVVNYREAYNLHASNESCLITNPPQGRELCYQKNHNRSRSNQGW